MKNKNLWNILVFLSIFAVFIAGCSQEPGKTPITEKTEEVADTGALEVKSSPSAAQVYLDAELKGNTPLALYNIPVGTHSIAVKKEGYTDFEAAIVIKIGRTEEVEATLTPLKSDIVEEKTEDAVPESASTPDTKLNEINLSSFAMYYDFDRIEFTELRTSGSDLFSRRYDAYVHFTALTPAKISIVDKTIQDVKKEDCISGDSGVAQVNSGQTLCIKTGEGAVAAVGGSWKTNPTEIEYILLS